MEVRRCFPSMQVRIEWPFSSCLKAENIAERKSCMYSENHTAYYGGNGIVVPYATDQKDLLHLWPDDI